MRPAMVFCSALVLSSVLWSCATAPGPVARLGTDLYCQQVEFHRIFNSKSQAADVVITTKDYREVKDQNEWRSILCFDEGKYTRFDYLLNRKYQYGADRKKHMGGFAWPVDYYDDPENRCLFLVEVYSEFALAGDNASYQSQGYAEELVEIKTSAYIVRRTKDGFAKEQAKDAESIKAADLIIRAAGQKKEEGTLEEEAQLMYLKFARAKALLQSSKEIDSAVDLQKIISEIETAESRGRKIDPSLGRCDLMNLDYLRVACRRLIEEIKQGKSAGGGQGGKEKSGGGG